MRRPQKINKAFLHKESWLGAVSTMTHSNREEENINNNTADTNGDV